MSGHPRLREDVCTTFYNTGFRVAPNADEPIMAAIGHKVTCKIPLIWCHGAAGSADTPFISYPENRYAGAFVRREPSGIVVISSEFGNVLNFGCPDSTLSIDEAIAWSAARFGTRTDKVAIGGVSMGGFTSLNWAWRNPSKVVAWAGHIPGINLTWVHDITGYRTYIEIGYGDIWVALPGDASSYASTPDHPTLDITGTNDIDIRVRASLPDWTPASALSLCSKWQTSGQFSWRFIVTATGFLQLEWSTNGTSGTTATSTVATGLANDAKKWLRVTLDVNNGSSGHTARFYTSDNETTWTQLGAAVTGAGTTSIFSGSSEVAVGASSASGTTPFVGNIYGFQLWNGLSSTTKVLDMENGGSLQYHAGSTSFTDSVGRQWTVNGTAAIDSTYVYERTDRDPALHHADIAAINAPMAAWYGLNDNLALPSFTEALAASVGSNFELFPSNGGHDFTATNADAFVIADWLIPKMIAADI